MPKRVKFKKPSRLVSEVFLHHSATANPNNDNVGFINRVAAGHSYYDGYADYHFYINMVGDIFALRPLNFKPQAQALHNTGTIAICVGGVGDSFTEEQKEAVQWLCNEINIVYEGNIVFRGHKEVNATLCPEYPYQEWLGLNKDGYMSLKKKAKPAELIEEDGFLVEKPKKKSFWSKLFGGLGKMGKWYLIFKGLKK